MVLMAFDTKQCEGKVPCLTLHNATLSEHMPVIVPDSDAKSNAWFVWRKVYRWARRVSEQIIVWKRWGILSCRQSWEDRSVKKETVPLLTFSLPTAEPKPLHQVWVWVCISWWSQTYTETQSLWHLSPSYCRGKQGKTEDEIGQEKDWKHERKTGRPQAGGWVLILKKVRENTLLLYYRLTLTLPNLVPSAQPPWLHLTCQSLLQLYK